MSFTSSAALMKWPSTRLSSGESFDRSAVSLTVAYLSTRAWIELSAAVNFGAAAAGGAAGSFLLQAASAQSADNSRIRVRNMGNPRASEAARIRENGDGSIFVTAQIRRITDK